jgi:hypothetical protein
MGESCRVVQGVKKRHVTFVTVDAYGLTFDDEAVAFDVSLVQSYASIPGLNSLCVSYSKEKSSFNTVRTVMNPEAA